MGTSSCHGVNNGQMLVGVMPGPDPRWTSEQWVRASGLVPSLPGQKWIQRLNWERYSDQHACQQVSFFMEVKHSRFLWSVTVRACLRLGTCYVLVLMELQCICGMGTQGDKSLLDAWAEMRRKLSSHSAQVWLYIMGGQHRERS